MQVEQDILQRHLALLQRRIVRPVQLQRSDGRRLLGRGRSDRGDLPDSAQRQHSIRSRGSRWDSFLQSSGSLASSWSWSSGDDLTGISTGATGLGQSLTLFPCSALWLLIPAGVGRAPSWCPSV